MKFWKSLYARARGDLKGQIVAQLRAAALRDNHPESASLDQAINAQAERMLNDFEHLCDRRKRPSFWYGVTQALLAYLLFLIVPAVAALLVATTTPDVWNNVLSKVRQNTIVQRVFEAPPAVKLETPTPTLTPTPAPTPTPALTPTPSAMVPEPAASIPASTPAATSPSPTPTPASMPLQAPAEPPVTPEPADISPSPSPEATAIPSPMPELPAADPATPPPDETS